MDKKSTAPKAAQARYPAASLLNSRALSGYQRDFAEVLLSKPEYTLQEAKAVLNQFFQGGDA